MQNLYSVLELGHSQELVVFQCFSTNWFLSCRSGRVMLPFLMCLCERKNHLVKPKDLVRAHTRTICLFRAKPFTSSANIYQALTMCWTLFCRYFEIHSNVFSKYSFPGKAVVVFIQHRSSRQLLGALRPDPEFSS